MSIEAVAVVNKGDKFPATAHHSPNTHTTSLEQEQLTLNTTPPKPSPPLIESKMPVLDAIQSGLIPPELSESWRLVDPASPEGMRFQQLVEGFARQLYTDKEVVAGRNKDLEQHSDLFNHDFDANPVRYVLSNLTEPNAWYVKTSNPPLIVLTAGLFASSKPSQLPPVLSEQDLLLVIGHETTHAKLHQRFNHSSNSKAEEAACDGIPMKLLHYMGQDPRAQLTFDERLRGKRTNPVEWHSIIDAHLVGPSRQSLYEGVLTALSISMGGVAQAQKTEVPLQREVIEILRSGNHTSFLDQLLAQNPDYTARSPHQKLDLLFETVRSLDHTIPIRIKDIAKEIQRLGITLDRKADRGAIDRWVECLHDFTKSYDSSQDNATSPEKGVGLLYKVLSDAAGASQKIYPLGASLREIATTMRAIVTANDEQDQSELRMQCSKLVTLYNSEPWAQTKWGISFLRDVAWPNFKLPSLELIIQRDKPKAAPWDFLVDNSSLYSTVAYAGVIMGLSPDPRIRGASLGPLSSGDGIPLAQLISLRGKASISAISTGPSDRDGNRLVDCDISKGGLITALSDRYNRESALTVTSSVSSEELYAIVTKLAHITTSPTQSEGTLKSSQLSINELHSILEFKGVSASKILHDIMKAPQVPLNPTVIGVLLEHAEFVIITRVALKLAKKGSSLVLEESSLDFLQQLTGLKASNAPLYQTIIEHLPPRIFELYHKTETDGRNQHSSGNCSALNLFVREIAPDLSAKNLWKTMSGSGSDDSRFVPPALRSILEERFEYPKTPTMPALAAWLEKNPLENYMAYSTGIVGIVTHSGIISLCTQDISHLIQAGGKSKTDLILTAKITTLLAPFIGGDSGFLRSEELAHSISALSFKAPEYATLDLACAWRDLRAIGLLEHTYEAEFLSHVIKRCSKEKSNFDKVRAIAETVLNGDRIRNVELRDKVLDIWVSAASKILGCDDNSAEFSTRVEQLLAPLVNKIPGIDLDQIGFDLATALNTQRACSYLIEEICLSGHSALARGLPVGGSLAESILHVARKDETAREHLLSYILGKGTNQETLTFAALFTYLLENTALANISWDSDKDDDHIIKDKKLETLASIKLLHTEFWRMPLEGRALVAKELLPTEMRSSVNSSFDFVVEKVLPETMPHYTKTREFLKWYVNALPEYSQHLAMAALLTAGEPGNEKTSSAGKILASFAESQGPAEIKFVQVLMDTPGLPDDFRRDLIENARHLKYKTQSPSRAQIFRILDMIEARDQVSFGAIGALRGCGSMNIVLEVADEKKKKVVLCLRRPHCEARAIDGFDTMLRMLAQMPSDDPLVESLRPIIDDAQKRASIEANFFIAQEQYERGGNNYRGYEALVDGVVIPMDAAEVLRSGEDYFTMTEMPGEHFVSLLTREGQTDKVKRIAKVILAREFNAILRGNFDCDRHGGQIAIGEKIGHFDFKAMALNTWPDEDHRQLAKVLVTTALSCKTLSDIPSAFVKTTGDLRRSSNDVSQMVTEAQKAILSLGDYFKALEPFSRAELLQLVFSAMKTEVPDNLKTIYADELASVAMPMINASGNPFASMLSKQVVSEFIKKILSGDPIPSMIKGLLPKNLLELLPDADNGIQFIRTA